MEVNNFFISLKIHDSLSNISKGFVDLLYIPSIGR